MVVQTVMAVTDVSSRFYQAADIVRASQLKDRFVYEPRTLS
jgi:hypothetical protein